ncbi:helix-turn-helix domain-containing protein [Gordonia sp. DT219]|uniref:helix-turn-helix domain-containing protein n=1 Tax=Gordonia sp. DT219 TaxID=3416658 RepID=UPI003CF3DDA6
MNFLAQHVTSLHHASKNPPNDRDWQGPIYANPVIIVYVRTDTDTQEAAVTRSLYSIDETAEQLGGISRTTVYELVSAGELTKVKLGRRGLVTAESIAAYVDRLKFAAGDAR